MRMQVELGVDLALRRHRIIELVEQSPLELPRLDLEFGPRGAIDNADRHAGMTDAIAQLRGKVPLDLLAAEVLDPRQDASYQNVCARLREERGPVRDAIARVSLGEMHLPGAAIVAGRGEQQILPERPEAQQADAELALQSPRALGFQLSLDGVADVGRHIVKVRSAVSIPAYALSVVLHSQVMLSLVLATGDDDRFRAGVDAVLDELGYRFQRIALRQRDNRDRVPVVADAEIAAGGYLCGLFDAMGHAAPAVEIAVVVPGDLASGGLPRIYYIDLEIRKTPRVARGQRRMPRQRDPRNLGIADINRPAGSLPTRGQFGGFYRSSGIETQHAV